MEGAPQETASAESKERFGNNVTINIHLIRHGEKDGLRGGLTKSGYEAAVEYGKGRGAKAYHSDNSRNKDTAQAIAENSPYKPRMRPELAVSGSDEWYKQYEAITKRPDGAGGMYDETRAIQELQFDIGREKRPEGFLSSKEVSAQLARQLIHFLEMSKRLKNDSEVNIDLVSHMGIIEHLLIDLFDGDPNTFLKEIGGGMRYLEGPEFKVVRTDKDTVAIEVTFDREIEKADGTIQSVHKAATLSEAELRAIAEVG